MLVLNHATLTQMKRSSRVCIPKTHTSTCLPHSRLQKATCRWTNTGGIQSNCTRLDFNPHPRVTSGLRGQLAIGGQRIEAHLCISNSFHVRGDKSEAASSRPSYVHYWFKEHTRFGAQPIPDLKTQTWYCVHFSPQATLLILQQHAWKIYFAKVDR